MVGLAAILLDDRGEVLHVNPRAVDLMGEDLFLSSGRLRARDAEIDGALGVAIHRALGGGSSSRLAIPLKSGQGTVGARIAAMESLDDDPFQLLRAVAFLESGTRSRPSAAKRNAIELTRRRRLLTASSTGCGLQTKPHFVRCGRALGSRRISGRHILLTKGLTARIAANMFRALSTGCRA